MTTSAQAKQRLTEATNAASLARTELNATREAYSVGEATQKDVNACLRRLAKAQEREEQERAGLRVVERREQAEAELAAQEADRIRRELNAITSAKRAAELQRWREFLEGMRTAALGFDQRLRGLSNDLREQGAGPIPSRWTSWGLLFQAIDNQLFHLPTPAASKEG
jgi:signal transduction histidine kinase